MALKLWVDDINSVAEALRGEYKQVGNRWKLDSEDFEGVDNPQDMKRALGAANSEAGTRRKAVEKWEKLGKTPEEIEALLGDLEKNQQTELEKKGEWEKLRTQMVEQHQTALQKIQKERDDAVKDADNFVVDSTLAQEIAQARGSNRVLLPHVRSRVTVQRDDTGKRNVVVLGEDGNPRVNAEGKPFKVADLLGEMKKDTDFSKAFEGPNGHGGGAAAKDGGGGGTPPGTTKRSEMTRDQRAAYVEEHGGDAYLKLPA